MTDVHDALTEMSCGGGYVIAMTMLMRRLDCQCQCQMSKTFIGGAVCREFELEAPAAEEMLD